MNCPGRGRTPVQESTDQKVESATPAPLDLVRETDKTGTLAPSQADVKPVAWYGDDFCVTEHRCTGTVPGQFLGIAGHGRRISFRLLHVWEFKTGRISRENVWLDSAAIVAQLTA